MGNEKTAIYGITGKPGGGPLQVIRTWGAEKGADTFCADYTALTGFATQDRTCLLGYAAKRQGCDIYQVQNDGSGLELLKMVELKQDYSAVYSFRVGGKPHILAYDSVSGTMDFYGLDQDLTLVRLLSYRQTSGLKTQGFTTIAPYSYRGSILLLGYDITSGTAVVYQISVPAEAPLAISEVWTKGWAPGWTRFAFFQLGGENFFLKSNPLHKNVNIDHMVDDPAEGSHPVGTNLPLALDLDAVAAFDCNHTPYFAGYRASEGSMTLSCIDGDCLGWTSVAELATVPGCSRLIPFYLNENPYLMLY